MVSFGQGCEGEPLARWKEIARAIRLIRARIRTRHASTRTPTARSPTRWRGCADAGLDSVRISLNSAAPDLYAAYYRPSGYGLDDVVRSIRVAKEKRLLRRAQPAHVPGCDRS